MTQYSKRTFLDADTLVVSPPFSYATLAGNRACPLTICLLSRPTSRRPLHGPLTEPFRRQREWESGNVDYLGKDSPENIQKKLDASLANEENKEGEVMHQSSPHSAPCFRSRILFKLYDTQNFLKTCTHLRFTTVPI